MNAQELARFQAAHRTLDEIAMRLETEGRNLDVEEADECLLVIENVAKKYQRKRNDIEYGEALEVLDPRSPRFSPKAAGYAGFTLESE